eukprot:symbB.v1.2.038750.t1/scaffold6157.1/size20450/2
MGNGDSNFVLQNVSGDLRGISGVAWLGCRDDPSFVDFATRLPCSSLTTASCSSVQHFCGGLCGCAHDGAFVAVTDASSLAILELDTQQWSLTEVASTAVGSIRDLTVTFVSTLSEVFVATATDGHVAIFSWQMSSQRLRHVQNLPGSGAMSAIPISTRNVSLLITAGDGDFLSQLFSVDGAFEWFAGPWSACNGSCEDRDVFVFRQRQVACRSMPSGLWHTKGCLGDAPVAEERCRGLEPCPKDSFSWVIGAWGPCEGLCGQGLRHRNLTCLRQLVAANGSAVGQPREAPETSCPTPPRSQLECTLKACGSFRLRNRVAIQNAWHVVEVAFFVDIACKQQVYGLAVASGRCADCVCYNATQHLTPCGPELAFDGYWDSGRLQASQWIAQCVEETPACAPSEAWIGLQVQATSEVRCVRMLQSADPAYMAREVALETMNTAGGAWEVVAEYANLQGAVILEDGNYSWDVLIGEWMKGVASDFGRAQGRLFQACSGPLHCNGHGNALGLPGSCSCACHEGFAGSSCNQCAMGFSKYPECAAVPSSSRIWRVVGLQTQSWHVQDLAFFQDLQCSPESLVPVLSWVLEYIGSRGPSQQMAVSPSRAFDEEGTGTTWIGNCLDCNASDEGPWVGVVLRHEVSVQCLRITQGKRFGASVALELWLGPWNLSDSDQVELDQSNGSDNETGNITVEESASKPTSPSLIEASNQSVSNSSGWWRLRSWPEVDTSGGVTRPATLRLTCNVGLPAAPHVLHNCYDKQPWQGCMAWCEEGYSGIETTFLCIEDYSFRGTTPECIPNECRLGIPSKVGLIIADGCTGLRTGQSCVASCATGLAGDDLEYECSADGYLREAKSRQVGVVPACASTFTPVEGTTGSCDSKGLAVTILIFAILGT